MGIPQSPSPCLFPCQNLPACTVHWLACVRFAHVGLATLAMFGFHATGLFCLLWFYYMFWSVDFFPSALYFCFIFFMRARLHAYTMDAGIGRGHIPPWKLMNFSEYGSGSHDSKDKRISRLLFWRRHLAWAWDTTFLSGLLWAWFGTFRFDIATSSDKADGGSLESVCMRRYCPIRRHRRLRHRIVMYI